MSFYIHCDQCGTQAPDVGRLVPHGWLNVIEITVGGAAIKADGRLGGAVFCSLQCLEAACRARLGAAHPEPR